jgi:hypothetical protein
MRQLVRCCAAELEELTDISDGHQTVVGASGVVAGLKVRHRVVRLGN